MGGPGDYSPAGPVQLSIFGVLVVFGVPFGAVLDPFTGAVAVEFAVALSVDEALWGLGFVAVDVVCFQ